MTPTPQDNAAFGRTPPQNVELEMCVLGAVMLEPKAAYPIAAAYLTRDSFYLEGHSVMFEIMGELYHRGIPPDSTSLLDELRARCLLDKVGGSGVLMGMLNSVVSAANIEYHARKVADKYDARRFIRGCTKAIEDAYLQEMPLEDNIDSMYAFLGKLRQNQPLDDAWALHELLMHEWEKISERETQLREAQAKGVEWAGSVGLPTGFPTLDKLTRQLRRGTVWVVGAPTNHGKSAWMGTVVNHLAVEQGIPCAIFSTEMTGSNLALRFLATNTKHFLKNKMLGIGTQRLDYPDLSNHEWSILTSAYQNAVVAPVTIVSKPMNVQYMRRALVALMAQPADRRPQAIFLDYLQRLQPHPDIHRNANSAEKVAYNMNSIFDMAIEFNIPIVVLAQYSRAHQGWPKLTDFEGSSAIEKAADVVVFLHRVKDTVEIDGQVQEQLMPYYFCIAKARDGMAGDHGNQYRDARVPAYFFGEITRFMEAYMGRDQTIQHPGYKVISPRNRAAGAD